ncbi:MAG: hypothetical protein ACI9YT_001961 [Halobacteriales archaeon]|jgi:hypothetical protein
MPSIDRFGVADARASTTALTELAMTVVALVAVLIVGLVLFDVLWSGLELVERILRFLPGVQPP